MDEDDGKLPVIDTISEATVFVARNAGRLLAAILPAGIALLLIEYLAMTSAENGSVWLPLGVLAAQCVLYALIAINVHRIALLGGDAVPTLGIVNWSMRESRFIGWMVLIYVAVMGIVVIPMLVLMLIEWAGGVGSFNVGLATLGMLVVYFMAVYVLCRLMMMFPATAVDRKPDLKWSWRLTSGNGWRIFAATTFIPGLIFGFVGVLLGFALFSQDPMVMNLAIQPLGIIGMVWGIAILSYSYRYLVDHRQIDFEVAESA